MRILRSRSFKRRAPSKEAKSIFIFCEGNKREYHYFKFFQELDSKINVQIFEPKNGDDNSPIGLYEKAVSLLSQYEVLATDEVWFVVDTDNWGEKLEQLYKTCEDKSNWHIGESNPCFELWLYFHIKSEKPQFDGMEKSANWKKFLNTVLSGGFDSRQHPINIETAINNATENFESTGHRPEFCNTSVWKLANAIYLLTKETLDGIDAA